MSKLNETVRLLREAAGQTQEEVATVIGASVSAYSNLENGKTQITIPKLVAIAKHMGLHAYRIMQIAQQATPFTANDAMNIILNEAKPKAKAK